MVGRFEANVAALETLRLIHNEARPATAVEQKVLARWSSWGAVPHVFDESKADWEERRERLRNLLTPEEYAAARRTTLNAHYTDHAYVTAVWAALDRLGFTGGDVLEPGSGAGTFIGAAPSSAAMTGVELDGTTAAIAAALYPHATIRAESFADTRLPRGSFDAVVGNVPFANISLHDPTHNAGGHSMHNHFILKSLDLTRPGGVVAVLTSSFTMDATNPAARREMNAQADLIGAVRLPTGAHRRSAGTDALTDVLILRKREPGTPPADVSWERVEPRYVGDTKIRINSYFAQNPDHILGTLTVGNGMYGSETVGVRVDDLAGVPATLERTLTKITDLAVETGQTWTPASSTQRQDRAAIAAATTDLWDGTIVAADTGFRTAADGQLVDLKVPKTHAAELRTLLGLRDAAKTLLEAEAASLDDTPALDAQRAALRTSYHRYVERYGPLNRYTERRTGRYDVATDPLTGEDLIDPDTGEKVQGAEKLARVTPPAIVRLKDDPHGPLVLALERFDDETQVAAPASILTSRVVAPRPQRLGADTPTEAIAISLDTTGGVDLALIADTLGIEETEARAALGTLVYDDPATDSIVHAAEYLSGDVRRKLDAAEAAVDTDPRFAVNVAALRDVQPTPLGVDEIEAKLGAVWISPQVHQQFLVDLLGDSRITVTNPLPANWNVTGGRHGVRATSEWGTDRMPASKIVENLMEQKPIEVTDPHPDHPSRRILNPVETTAAQEKAEAIAERFAAWAWEDPARATELADVYNRAFNSIVLRDYASAGDHLTLPGLTETITLRPHQRAAVARMIAEPAVGLFHQVGAGKTLEMIAGATELKRLGIVSKPAVVVPNHMLEQFSREWLQAYPQARVLAAGSGDVTADKRRLFIARAAANDWDAVIMTQEAFKKIGVSPDFEATHIAREVADYRTALETARAEGSEATVKTIEKAVTAAEERQKKALDVPRDPGLTFEATGIDYLIVDEAHTYKNLGTPSHIRDAAISGGQRTSDMLMKLEYLRDKNDGRVGTLATATPLANSVTEAYVMQRYLRPDLLRSAGITSFDGWAATFGQTVTQMEMGPAGGFRLKTRFAKFQNVPEMLRMWHVFADVKTAEDLQLPVPAIAARDSDGKRDVETVVLDPTPELSAYIAHIADRAEAVAARRVTPEEDNMLLISTDGRKAALDLRLVDQDAEPTGAVKLDAVADRIHSTWLAHRDRVYTDTVTGAPSPVTGALQLVFSDLGTPNPDRWNTYHELRSKLVAAGMPAASIRFIHEAKNDADKNRLFAAARAGHIAVLIGSTAKMGVGTNVQDRIVAMHHVDCPWRPADLEQRDGRGIRQGNQNPEVAIYRYVVEGSFDAYSWQTVGRKAEFIAQVMRGRLDSREIDDVGDTALSAAEAKALASGNPLVLEKANADADLAKLRRQETAHHRAQASLRYRADAAESTIADATRDLAALTDAATCTTDTAGDAFTMRIDGRTVTSRTEAVEVLADWEGRRRHEWRRADRDHPITLGAIGGHDITLYADTRSRGDYRRETVAVISLAGVPRSTSIVPDIELSAPSVGTIRALENKTTAISRHLADAERELAGAQRDATDATARLGAPFAHADALDAARARVAAVDQAIADQAATELEETAVPNRDDAPAIPAPADLRPHRKSDGMWVLHDDHGRAFSADGEKVFEFYTRADADSWRTIATKPARFNRWIPADTQPSTTDSDLVDTVRAARYRAEPGQQRDRPQITPPGNGRTL